jgi:hypothetical protein
MVLMMICGKELWVPLDREIAQQMGRMEGRTANRIVIVAFRRMAGAL